VTRANLPALGYGYVALALPALIVGPEHRRAASSLLTAAAFCLLWFLASLRSQLIRFDPDGFFASAVVLGGASFLPLQALAILSGETGVAALSSACAATVIVGSSLAAWRARKIPRWFGQAGIAGGLAVLLVGLVEGAADWAFADESVFASSLGFMVWVVVTASYLLRR
jgi:VIT1/CCC1 family predicted Fe2+/Mn2+ transporter